MSENKITEQLEKKIKFLMYVIMFLVIIIAILTVLLIGDYVGLWGGVMIEDPNCPGLPLVYIRNLKL